MTKDEMKQRTKEFALRVIKMTDHLPKSAKGRVLASQILRSATSVAANYRAACRGRSKAEFAAKIGIALEECDETQLWLELIAESGLLPSKRLTALVVEANELTAILFTTFRSSRA